jgi:hypothetical protein
LELVERLEPLERVCSVTLAESDVELLNR